MAGCSREETAAPAHPTVSVAYPLTRDVVDWDDYVGRFTAAQDVQVMPRVSGQIVGASFHEGISVSEDQFLFQIDPRPFRAALLQARADEQRAEATLANARTEFARARELLAAEAISREEYEQKLAAVRTAEAGVLSAQATVRSRALDLNFTTIRAPISGRISDMRVHPGDFVIAGQTLLTHIVSIDPIQFSFDGAETFYLKYIRQAQAGARKSSRYAPNPVDIQLADENEYRWHGRMTFVDVDIATDSGTIRAHADVPNPDGFLIPGMFGRARLLGSGPYRGLLIPDEAIVTDQTRRTVFVIGKDGKAASRNVETGPMVEGLRVIKSGIGPSDRVVLDRLARLGPGASVTVRLTTIRPRAANDAPVSRAAEAPPPAQATVR
jgi:RND family efflux transporter MFP subunit